ncbi:MAG: hypothetical protein ACTHMP_11505 [Thermomicrobiales bacterium]
MDPFFLKGIIWLGPFIIFGLLMNSAQLAYLRLYKAHYSDRDFPSTDSPELLTPNPRIAGKYFDAYFTPQTDPGLERAWQRALIFTTVALGWGLGVGFILIVFW